MQSRRDQVQAHQFLMSRLTAGLLRADPDEAETPTRRTNRGVAYGAAVAALIAAGALVFGLLSPRGNSSWRSGHSLIVEKDTGTRYVFDGQVLRPVRNYPSARLLLGATMSTLSVSAKSLSGTRHGPPAGIPGGPDALPAADAVNTGPWQVCTAPGTGDTGAVTPRTVLAVNAELPGTGVQGDQGVLVTDPEGNTYLLWQDNRLRLADGTHTAVALGYGSARPMPVSAAFIDAVPAGPDLAAPAVIRAGSTGPRLDGRPTRVGQVFTVATPGSAAQYYLLTADGLTPVSTTQVALLLGGSSTTRTAYEGRTPTASAISAQTLDGARAPDGSDGARAARQAGSHLPAAPPKLVAVGDGQAACLRVDPRGSGLSMSLALVSRARAAADATDPAGAQAPACLAVDGVSVPAGGGSLVRALNSAGGAAGSNVYLVTDAGIKYRVADSTTAKDLGYSVSQIQGMLAPLLAMLPTGPDLSPQAATAGRAAVSGQAPCAAEKSGGA